MTHNLLLTIRNQEPDNVSVIIVKKERKRLLPESKSIKATSVSCDLPRSSSLFFWRSSKPHCLVFKSPPWKGRGQTSLVQH